MRYPFTALLLALAPPALADDPPLPPQHTGRIYITGYYSDNIGEFLPDMTPLRTFTAPGLDRPRGITTDDEGNLVVVSQGSDRIFVFDLEGTVVREVVHPDLTNGTGLAQAANGDWYVANFTPGRILVFGADWGYKRTVEWTGMTAVNCVSFDPDGSFAATDASHAEVHRFDQAGNHLETLTHSSLGSPMSIAMDSSGAHYVSNGGSGVVTKFDASWSFLTTFGGGVLASPQGIAIDEHDRLTITNFSAQTVHRYDTQGVLLETFPLTGVMTGRNLSFQISPFALAREGSVGSAMGFPTRVLSVNGQTGDALGRVTVSANAPLQFDFAASPFGPDPARITLFLWREEPTPLTVSPLPLGGGLFSFPALGGEAVTLVNSFGREGILGTGLLPPMTAPGTAFTLPGGVGTQTTVTLQALVEDLAGTGSGGFSATNALVIEVQ
ncbi:MAG: hypothetical protein GY711_18800 [bacterium]|nr:hypothetical protein [bacterium]